MFPPGVGCQDGRMESFSVVTTAQAGGTVTARVVDHLGDGS